jgi:hypothetical protein
MAMYPLDERQVASLSSRGTLYEFDIDHEGSIAPLLRPNVDV